MLVLAAALIAGCGGSSDSGPESKPAPAATEFPTPAAGQSLIQFLGANATQVDRIVAPAGKVYRVGENRFAFGIFNVDRSQITDATVALYVAPGKSADGPASGPYPAGSTRSRPRPRFTRRRPPTIPRRRSRLT